jgi:tripartite-type tricarboxylate transporter receptor subunit TctC
METSMFITRILKPAIVASLLAIAGIAPAHADDWPSKPIRFIVPFPPGGGTDIVARAAADKLGALLGQQIIIENRAGAGTIIGTEAAAKSSPDGYTFLFTSSAYSVNPSLQPKLPYDPEKSFAPIGLASLHPFVLVAHPSLPANNVRELIDYAKKNPGKLNYASVGNGSSQHIEMEYFKRMAGIDIAHIPYKGSAPAVTDLLGGQVLLMFNGISPTLAYIRSGQLKVLATDSERQVPLLKGVPTVAESGLPGFKFTTWSGLLAPAGTPRPIIARMASELQKVVTSTEFRDKMGGLGLEASSLAPDQFAAFLHNDMATWARYVRDSGAKLD